MNDNTMNDEFWSNYDIQNITLQNAFLLYVIIEYNSTIYDKLACRKSFLGGTAYIQEIITSTHP